MHVLSLIRRSALTAVALAALASVAAAQLGGQSSSGSTTRATQLPLSGRQSTGSVSAQQSTASGTGVSTVDSSIQVQGNFQGSIPDPEALKESPANPLSLSLTDAIARGLRFNLGEVSAAAALRSAHAQRLQSLSALLPSIAASISENVARVDLAAEGFSANLFGGGGSAGTGFNIPSVVGPFHYYDARATFNQTGLDATAIQNYRSAKSAEAAASFNARDARELVILAVAGTYLRVQSSAAQVASQKVQVDYSSASYKQAADQFAAGTRARIDANRSLVELQTQQQRLSSRQADLAKQKLLLARLIGLPLNRDLVLSDQAAPLPTLPFPLDEAIHRALDQRADLQAAVAQLRAAEQARRAAAAERIPSLNLSGFYGIEGINPNSGANVYSGSATLNIPVWQGGRTHADILAADATLAERRAEYQDQASSVELDVRSAYIDLDVATNQVKVADSNRSLALDTLTQSQDRFAAGVTDSVEVVQSQETLASAEHDYISSLFSQNLARVALARAMGQAEKDLPALLKGQ